MNQLNVGILLFPDVEVLDFAGPFEVFSRTRLVGGTESRRSDDSAPYKVFTVARTRDQIPATGGLLVTPHFSFSDHPEIDLLVVPGGFGTRALLNDEEILEWIRKVSAEATLTTSVCTGSLLLTKSGLLQGKKATTHWGALDLLESLSQTDNQQIQVMREERYVDAGNVITSAGVSAGIEMSLYMVERMFGKSVADETAHYIEYRR